MPTVSAISIRANCPCCGYLTLSARNTYNICKLCNWEDDGQGDEDADKVRGGPNADYSLTEARANFKRYRVMYAPGLDPRAIGAASRLEFETKGRLMAALERRRHCQRSEAEQLDCEIAGLEQTLYEEILRRVLEYDRMRLAASQARPGLVPGNVGRQGLAAVGRWIRSLEKFIASFDLK